MPSSRFVLLLCCFLIAAPLAAQRPANPAPALESIRQAAQKKLVEGVAGYPDEVAAAILEVAQDPAALLAGQAPSSAAGKSAYDYLSKYPEVLEIMEQHPLSTGALGEYAQKSGTDIWKSIDAARQDLNIAASVENQLNPLKGQASQHEVNLSDSAGHAARIQQSSQSAATEDGYTRQGSGSATANQGSVDWNRQGQGTRTQTGAQLQSQTHLQSGSGNSVDVEHSTEVEQTESGVDIAQSGSATSSTGQSADWQRETSATTSDEGLALQFSRPTGSASGFSVQSFDPATLSQTMEQAARQQRQTFQAQEQKLSGMTKSAAPSFSPKKPIEPSKPAPSRGSSGSGNRGGGGGGNRR